MRRVLYVLLGLVLLAHTASAVQYVKNETITVSTVAIGFTAANINTTSGHPQADSAACSVATNTIAFTLDGTTPTSSSVQVPAGSAFSIVGNDLLNKFSAIRVTSDASLACTYFSAQ